MTATKVNVEYTLTNTLGNPQFMIQRLVWPNRCACCGAPNPKTAFNLELPMITSTAGSISQSITRYPKMTWAVPHCEICRDHVKENMKRSEKIKSILLWILIWAVVAFIGVAVLGGKLPLILAVIAMGIIVIVALMWRQAFRSIPRTPTCKSDTGPLFAVVSSWGPDRINIYFYDPAYGEDFAKLNRLKADVDPVHSREKTVSEDAKASQKKNRKINLVVLLFFSLLDVALIIYRVHLSQGNNLRGMYQFGGFITIPLIVFMIICLIGAAYSGSSLGLNPGNGYIIWYIFLMLAPGSLMFFQPWQ